jgi:hypothetical protein
MKRSKEQLLHPARLAELRRKLEDPDYLADAIDAAAEKIAQEILPRVKK